MKGNKFYRVCSAIYSSVVLVLLFLTDILYLSDKSKLSLIISVLGMMELIKYFIVSSQYPEILKSLASSNTSFSYSAQKSSDKRLKQSLKGVILMTVMTAVYHIVIILLGASVVENFEETLLLSLLLSVLTVMPLCLYFGPNSALAAWLNVYPSHATGFEITLKQACYLTLVGAWVGAFVIPLDWDRPWQKWPVPCSVGALTGYCVSHIIKIPSPVTKYPV